MLCLSFRVFSAEELSPLFSFEYKQLSVKDIPGSASTCNENGYDADTVGNLRFLLAYYQNGCYTNGAYNDLGYQIETGELITGDKKYDAYKVHPVKKKAINFTGSKHYMWYNMPEKGELKVYTFAEGSFTLVATKSSEESGWLITDIIANYIKEPTIYLFFTEDVRLSEWPLISDEVEAAEVETADSHTIEVHRFAVSGSPVVPERDWDFGPNTHDHKYNTPKAYVQVSRSESGSEGVVWQDKEDKTIYVTWFDDDLKGSETLKLLTTDVEHLEAAAGKDGMIIFLTIGTEGKTKSTGARTTMYKYNGNTGAQLVSKVHDSSKEGWNIWKHFAAAGSMVWNKDANTVGFTISRTMTTAGDGHNHQGTVFVIVDTDDLTVVKYWGQTASHSFGNTVTLGSGGEFLGLDMGDMYPRGILFSRFTPDKKENVKVYSMKRKHGVNPKDGIDEYTAISGNGKTYYKYSGNDNGVYTEIAHSIIEVSDGFMIFFSAEKMPLDNSKIGSNLNAPRNAGFVKVSKDLEIISSGETEKGGYYTGSGEWREEINEGLNWLTEYDSMETNVSRIKAISLEDNTILVYWEIWTGTEFLYNELMIVDSDGKVVKPKWRVDFPMRLSIQDELFLTEDNHVLAYTGTVAGQIVRFKLCLGEDGCKDDDGGYGGNGGDNSQGGSTFSIDVGGNDDNANGDDGNDGEEEEVCGEMLKVKKFKGKKNHKKIQDSCGCKDKCIQEKAQVFGWKALKSPKKRSKGSCKCYFQKVNKKGQKVAFEFTEKKAKELVGEIKVF